MVRRWVLDGICPWWWGIWEARWSWGLMSALSIMDMGLYGDIDSCTLTVSWAGGLLQQLCSLCCLEHREQTQSSEYTLDSLLATAGFKRNLGLKGRGGCFFNLFSLVINLLTQIIGLIKMLKLQSGEASRPHTCERNIFSNCSLPNMRHYAHIYRCSPKTVWIRCTHQYQYMFLKIIPKRGCNWMNLSAHPLYAQALVSDRLWVGAVDGESLTTNANERSSTDKRHVATDQASRAWRSPTFPPARHLWRIWGFHNFLFFLKRGWQHLVHTAVLHLESNLKRARGRGEERSSLVIKGSRMASVC